MARLLIGYCGAYCTSCPIFIASTSSDQKKKAQLAGQLSEEKGEKISPEDINCWGCRALSKNSWSRNCQFKKCASDKGIEFCYQCGEYSCSDLQKHYEKHPDARESLKKISKIGVDAFLSEMAIGESEDD